MLRKEHSFEPKTMPTWSKRESSSRLEGRPTDSADDILLFLQCENTHHR